MATLSPLPPLPQFHPRCKICDFGDLVPKRVFRMSGPVVAIGFILLVPSVLGMIVSGLLYFGIITTTAITAGVLGRAPDTPTPTGPVVGFRRACVNTPEMALPMRTREQYCECSLSEYKTSGSAKYATDVCSQKLRYNALPDIDEQTQRLYNGLIDTGDSQNSLPTATKVGAVLGTGMVFSGYTIGLGVAFFVSGLLGWLLVMKKRVLQCNACGATVNAS